MDLVSSTACLLFVKTRCFQTHPVYFLSQPRNRQFSRKQYFKTTILALETLNLIGLNIVLRAFTKDRAKTEICRRVGGVERGAKRER